MVLGESRTARGTRRFAGASVIAGLALALVFAATSVGERAGGAGSVFAPKDCTKPRQEPSRIVMACGDFGLYVRKLEWSSWGGVPARGRGQLRAKVCEPDCASGHYESYRVRVRLRRVSEARCGGRRVPLYRRMILKFPGRRPDFHNRIDNTKLYCISTAPRARLAGGPVSCRRIKNPYPDTRYEGIDLRRIRATEIGCPRARRVVRGAHKKALRTTPPPSGIERFQWRRWEVEGDLRGDADKYVAKRGARRVRWVF